MTIISHDAPHHVGGAEAMVKPVKISVTYLPTTSLSLMEFDCILNPISSTMSNHPLGFNTTGDLILNPNLPLLGWNYNPNLPPVPISKVYYHCSSHVHNTISIWF